MLQENKPRYFFPVLVYSISAVHFVFKINVGLYRSYSEGLYPLDSTILMNIPIIAGTVFALMSAWMLRFAIQNLQKADISSDWPSVKGRIVKSELWGKRNIDGEQKPVEKLSVEYQYEVNGNDYRGTKVAFYTLVYPETLKFAKENPENSEISVFYNPNTPSESVLVTGSKEGNKRYSEIILASLGLIVSAAIAISGVMGIIG